jgi:cytochrome c oxidase accessory protein FixG
MDTRNGNSIGNEGTIETVDVAAVNASEHRSLYAKRPRIHPKRARGDFRRLKWIIMVVTLGIYYITPWLRWDRGDGVPDQAVLIDIPGGRFYFFFIEIWPQEFYYITGLLILAAIGLFLFTSLAGRVWCGYSCPQTVWTDLFLVIERRIEGDRNARLRLDKEPWTARKIGMKAAKHGLWLLIGVMTGGAWVFYFADAPTLALQFWNQQAPPIAQLFVLIFTVTTYVFGGLAREQVCTYMCPWPRIQGAMLDDESLVVSYHPGRGEPRQSHKQGDSWEGRGHCVDCKQCVVVCPMGIDIREGDQLECITCALCIDACDEVMDKLDLPRGLISYDTHSNLEKTGGRGVMGGKFHPRLIRPRTVIYSAILVLVSAIMLYALLTRSPLDVTIQRDRNPVFVTLADGGVRNGYTLKILNKNHAEGWYSLTTEGIPGALLKIIGASGTPLVLTVPQDSLRAFRVFVSVPPGVFASGSHDLVFNIKDLKSGLILRQTTSLKGPAK